MISNEQLQKDSQFADNKLKMLEVAKIRAEIEFMKTQEKYMKKEGERENLRTGAIFWAATITLIISLARIFGIL